MLLIVKRSSFEKRVARKCYPFFVLISALLFSALAFAEITPQENSIKEVRQLAEAGAVSLALHFINQQQPEFDPETPGFWTEWERERISVYQLGQRWQALQDHVADYEYDLPNDFYYWVKQHQVDALLALKQGKQARQILQTLIWNENKSNKEQQLQQLAAWQKKVIESYLVDDEVEDALLAVQRYFQDYKSEDIEDRLLRARILLLNQRADEVVALLKQDTKNPQAQVLYLLAQLRSNKSAANKILKTTLGKMRKKSTNEKLKFLLWAVVAESAKIQRDSATIVIALEYIIAGHKNISLPLGLFEFSADDLWDAYTDYALAIGNQEQYLIGDDQQWLKAARKAQKKLPIKARSLYALVMLRGQNETARVQAAKEFLNLMHKRKRGASLVTKLFLQSQYFLSKETIPSPVRYDLVNISLSRSNIELASELMTTIETAPEGIDDFQWQLQRARVFVLGGKPEAGGIALTQLLEKYQSLAKAQFDHFLQVLFDLQTVKQHELAFTLFKKLLSATQDIQQQREIFFWMADSLKAQNSYAESAHYYLRSALHGESKGLDPWGQTARYEAAEMLSNADLLDDAHTLYDDMLRVTKEPARRAVLKHELQKLQLLKNSKTSASLIESVSEFDLDNEDDDSDLYPEE